jgi:hypothetical protein
MASSSCILPWWQREGAKVDSSWNVMAHGDTGRGVKGKLANRVGSQYSSHYIGTWCIQHYYHWCAHLGCRKKKSGLCACVITFQLVSTHLPFNFGAETVLEVQVTAWVPGGGPDGCGKSPPTEIRFPNRPADRKSLYRGYSGPHYINTELGQSELVSTSLRSVNCINGKQLKRWISVVFPDVD